MSQSSHIVRRRTRLPGPKAPLKFTDMDEQVIRVERVVRGLRSEELARYKSSTSSQVPRGFIRTFISKPKKEGGGLVLCKMPGEASIRPAPEPHSGSQAGKDRSTVNTAIGKGQAFLPRPDASISSLLRHGLPLPPALQPSPSQPQGRARHEDPRLREPRAPKLGVQPHRPGVEDRRHARDPVDGPREGGRVDGLAGHLVRRPDEVRPPRQERGGHAEEHRQGDGLAAVEPERNGL